MVTIPASLLQIGMLSTAAVTLLTAILTRVLPWARAKLDGRSVEKHLGTEVNAERSIHYYVRPRCQDLDPAGAEEPRLVLGVNQKLFEKLDEVLGAESEYRYIILLADSGMGKSSALINYCARHLRKIRKSYKVALVPLGVADADQRIKDIEDKKNTVLFLDALDEDVLAIADHIERLRLLVEATRGFRRILITCRTQFFAKDEELPMRTGIIRVGARGASEPAEYYFHKLYLSPFTDVEIDLYIRRRYPLWKLRKRILARRMVLKIPNLSARPMLLSHIDVLIRRKRTISYSFELYEEMVEAWLTREKGFIPDPKSLQEFSERLAVDLYIKSDIRGSERARPSEVEELARKWGINLDSWQLTGRSLLNRDAEGNYKFAHRTIMEFLFISRYLHGELMCLNKAWTDQMRSFFQDMVYSDIGRIGQLIQSGQDFSFKTKALHLLNKAKEVGDLNHISLPDFAKENIAQSKNLSQMFDLLIFALVPAIEGTSYLLLMDRKLDRSSGAVEIVYIHPDGEIVKNKASLDHLVSGYSLFGKITNRFKVAVFQVTFKSEKDFLQVREMFNQWSNIEVAPL